MGPIRARVPIRSVLRSQFTDASWEFEGVQALRSRFFSLSADDGKDPQDQHNRPVSSADGENGDARELGRKPEQRFYSKVLGKGGSMDGSRWAEQLTWITSIMEPLLKLYRRALPPGAVERIKGPASTRSLVDIAASLHRSSAGMQDWGLADLTLGLYLLSVRHDTEMVTDTIPGVEVTSDLVVQNCIYHVELAKAAYAKNVAGLARACMLRESNIVKFVGEASVMRPAYYIGIDTRYKLVVMGIRGTHSVHDVITDLASEGEQSTTFEGLSVHFGTAEAARWFLQHEAATLKKCLQEHEGYKLRIVGHSLGGATAALMALMLRKHAARDLGFSPDIVSAVTIATPPCVPPALAVECKDYITTMVLKDDVVPRISALSLLRLRNEILELDWASVVKEADIRTALMDLVTGTMQAVSSMQDVARRYATYAKISSIYGNGRPRKADETKAKDVQSDELRTRPALRQSDRKVYQELVCPGKLFHIRGKPREADEGADDLKDGFMLLEGSAGSKFGRIVLRGSLLADHKCDNHLFALRDVLKGLPVSQATGGIM